MNDQTKFIIVDPSLKDRRGHHYELTRRITSDARQMGIRPVWLCHRGFDINATQDADIFSVFDATLYDAYMQKPIERSRRPGINLLRRASNKLNRAFGRRDDGEPKAALPLKLASTIQSAIDDMALKNTDHVLIHTADGNIYEALNLVFSSADQVLPHFHVCTPYDPNGVMPNQAFPGRVSDIVKEWERRRFLDDFVHLYAENPRLAGHLSRLWLVQVESLDAPLVIDVADAKRVFTVHDPAVGMRDRIIISALGPARVEKGFHILPDIVSGLIARIESAGSEAKYPHFVIQSTPQIVGYTKPITEALERLAVFEPEWVTFIPDVLNGEAFLREISASDVVLMPYGHEQYRYRGSIIAMEALCLGKIIVATEDTYPASLIFGGSGETAQSTSDFVDALLRILQNFDEYAAEARLQAMRYLEARADENYVRFCLARASDRGALGVRQ